MTKHPPLPEPLRKRCESFAKRTHCPEGHRLTPQNTIYEKRGKYTSRRCKACRRKQQRELYHMANKEAREQVMNILREFTNRETGSGVDSAWEIKESRYGVWLHCSYHCMDPNGYYCGWANFSVFFRWNEPLRDFKLHFTGKGAAYLNKKLGLRELLENRFLSTLSDICAMKGLQYLYKPVQEVAS